MQDFISGLDSMLINDQDVSPPQQIEDDEDENLTEIDDEQSCNGKRIKNLKDQNSPRKIKKKEAVFQVYEDFEAAKSKGSLLN